MITFLLFFYSVFVTVCFYMLRKKAMVYKKMCENFDILEGSKNENGI